MYPLFSSHVKLHFPLYYSEKKHNTFEVRENDGTFEAFPETEGIIFMTWAFQSMSHIY